MTYRELSRRLRRPAALVTVLLISVMTLVAGSAGSASADDGYTRLFGTGSTWSENALKQWIRNVAQYGQRIDYGSGGSSKGRADFKNGTSDFAVSEIPYGLSDKGVFDQPPGRPYAYMPVVAGGTSFMYNLKIGGRRVTNLRLSGPVIAKMFTGGITTWNDPAIAADNPGLALPAVRVVPVVRSDGSGTTAQFTTWLSRQYPDIWNSYCANFGIAAPCGLTSTYPVKAGANFNAQSSSTNLAGFVAQEPNVGAIGYVEYSYARNAGFPVAKVLNNANYYTEPTASNVAVGLQAAKINEDPGSAGYLTQDLSGVYTNADPRSYPLSSYSYMIIPTDTSYGFSTKKGYSLAAFANYFLCEGQRQADDLGYSPLPRNLVVAGLAQVQRIPGSTGQQVDISTCNNPTFSPDGSNLLAKNAPQPPACDAKGATQCTTGTGGAKAATPVSAGSKGGAAGGAGNGSTASGKAATGTGASAPGTDVPAADQGAQGVVDPETGQISAGAGGGDGSTLAATPVSLSASSGWHQQQTLALLSVLALLGVVIVPPVLSRTLGRGTRR